MTNVMAADHSHLGIWPEEALITRTTDLSEARDAISRIYCSYRFDAPASADDGPTVMHSLQGRHVGISHFAYGTPISTTPEEFETFLLVLTTARGTATVSSSDEWCSGGEGMTVVTSPRTKWRFDYSADNEQIVTRIDANRLAHLASNMLGCARGTAPGFRLSMDNQHLRQRWMASIANLRGLLDPFVPSRTREMLLPQAEEMLILSLLLDQPGTLSRGGERGSHGATPAVIKRALDYIEDHVEDSLTLDEIATAARCSIRSLHRSFRTYRDISVMQYVKERRMVRVREELLGATSNVSVTSVALRWGFTQLGQFAADYRAMFGEKPSETLRKVS